MLEFIEIIEKYNIDTAINIVTMLTIILITVRHKFSVKNEFDEGIVKLKSELSGANTIQSIKFFRLQEKRADVIAETYSLLIALYDAGHEYVTPLKHNGANLTEMRNNIIEASENFNSFYRKKRIFLPKMTAKTINTISSDLIKAINDYHKAENQTKERTPKMLKAYQIISGDINNALQNLTDDFRKLLGDDTPKN